MDHKIIPDHIHRISLEHIDPYALLIIEKLRAAGFVAYVVGGGVRDLLLGRPPKDFDISTSAKPEEIKKVFRNSILIGKRFRLAHVRFGKKIFEVSTFRSGDLEDDELITRDNTWGYPEEDALRRDFTINGLFYDPVSQHIIDYVDGYADIEKGVLRTIGAPFVRFKQDPVRMLRLLKFQARFNFSVCKEALIALAECRQEILKSASPRVLEELLRMLESGYSLPFITLLCEHGLMHHILPELALFIEKKGAQADIYPLLKHIDQILLEEEPPQIDRALLVSLLVFPLFQEELKRRFAERKKKPHLGLIFSLAQEVIDRLFHGFFRVPKRLKGIMAALFVDQYRLETSHENRKIRIPSHEHFKLSLDFLKLRGLLHPRCAQAYEMWFASYEAHIATKPARSEEESVERPKRKRRKRSHAPPR